MAYLELEAYSESWYIQNPRRIQNTVNYLRWNVLQKSNYLAHFRTQARKNPLRKKFLIIREMEFSCSNIKRFLIFWEMEAPKKFLIFQDIELSSSNIKKFLIFREIKLYFRK